MLEKCVDFVNSVSRSLSCSWASKTAIVHGIAQLRDVANSTFNPEY